MIWSHKHNIFFTGCIVDWHKFHTHGQNFIFAYTTRGQNYFWPLVIYAKIQFLLRAWNLLICNYSHGCWIWNPWLQRIYHTCVYMGNMHIFIFIILGLYFFRNQLPLLMICYLLIIKNRQEETDYYMFILYVWIRNIKIAIRGWQTPQLPRPEKAPKIPRTYVE